tara:strand:- start:4367 stop:4567 length:201 start_codon:yes stop_codon:yes gene_type:complete
MQHRKDTVYRKMRMNATILPAELVMIVKDLDQRLLELEGKDSDGVEKPSPSRQKSSRVPKEKVSSD